MCTVHTTDACRRGTLSVTPAVLMCGTEASLSPRTGPVCAPFEIADCGKDQRLLPAASFLSSRSRRLMSIGVFEICSMQHERPALHAVTQKARHQHTNNFKGTLYKHSGARCSDPPPKIRSVLIILVLFFFFFFNFDAFAQLLLWSSAGLSKAAAPCRAMTTLYPLYAFIKVKTNLNDLCLHFFLKEVSPTCQSQYKSSC